MSLSSRTIGSVTLKRTTRMELRFYAPTYLAERKGVSPFVASVVVSARYRVAREMVEAIAEDVAGMRREVIS